MDEWHDGKAKLLFLIFVTIDCTPDHNDYYRWIPHHLTLILAPGRMSGSLWLLRNGLDNIGCGEQWKIWMSGMMARQHVAVESPLTDPYSRPSRKVVL